MCDPLTIAAAAVTIGGTMYGGMAANAQSKYENRVAQENRRHELVAAQDARERGALDQMRHYRKLAFSMGEARAKQSASGLDIGFGSAADLEQDMQMIGLEDSAILAENTRREVKGYEINAANYTMEGRAARSRGKAALIGAAFESAGTILGSASQHRKSKIAARTRSLG